MNYSVNTTLFSSIFAVPADIVDKHIRLANGDQLKVLLWILRNNPNNPDIKAMCAALKMNESDAADYLQYWVLTGVLNSDESAPVPVAPPAPQTIAQPKATETKKEIKDPDPVKPTMSEIVRRIEESPEIKHLLKEIQGIVGTIGYNEQSTLIHLHDYYGLPTEVLFMLIDYCSSIGKTNCNYILAVGKDWGSREIDTVEKAAEQIAALKNANAIWKELAVFAGFKNEKPTTKQNEFLRKWSNEFKFGIDMIIAAYEEMTDRTGKISFGYMNKVLESWYNKGYKKPADIENEKEKAKKPETKSSSNLTQASYDLDKFRQQSLHGELKYERKKKE